MKSEDKELLKQELIKYNRKNYSGNSVKTISIELISWLANDFKDRKHAVRLLVENEYGLLGNLLFKYMREPDEEIRELITELDTKLVKDAYRRFGELLITDGNGGSSFCLKVLLKEHPKLVSILSLMQGYSIEEEDAYEIAPYCPQVIGVVSPSHKWERKFVKQMTRINPCCIEYADRKFKSDSEIARNCVLDNPEMIRCVDKECNECEHFKPGQLNTGEELLKLVKFFIRNGFDVEKYGDECLASLCYSTGDKWVLRIAKELLDNGAIISDVDDNPDEGALGTASWNVGDWMTGAYANANLMSSYCALLYAAGKGEDYHGIGAFQECIGHKVRKVEKVIHEKTPKIAYENNC